MFLQGVYLHGKLTTNVFDKGTPFKIYYAVGWGKLLKVKDKNKKACSV